MIVFRIVLLILVWCCCIGVLPVQASLNDDRFDGNIFVLYGGNGSLVPPRVTLKQSLEELQRPAMLFFYVDDSTDCKHAAPLLNQVQLYYSKQVSIIPVNVDSLLPLGTGEPDNPSTYYHGVVPQTVLIDTDHHVQFDREGLVEPALLDASLQGIVGAETPSPMAKLKNDTPFFNEFNR